MTAARRIFDIIESNPIRHLSIHHNIDKKKLALAYDTFGVPTSEKVVALYDSTSLGSGKTGIFFGENGIHWNNDILSAQPGQGTISYNDLLLSNLGRENVYEVTIADTESKRFILGYVGEGTKPSRDLLKLLFLLKRGLTINLDTPADVLAKELAVEIEELYGRRSLLEWFFKILSFVIALIIIIALFNWLK